MTHPSPASIVGLLDAAVGSDGRRSAIRTAAAALEKYPSLHSRPVYAALLRALSADAASMATDANEAEWATFVHAMSVIDTQVLRVESGPVQWADRAFVTKALASILSASPAPSAFVVVFKMLLDAADSKANSEPSDFARCDAEIRAAVEALLSFTAAHARMILLSEHAAHLGPYSASLMKSISGVLLQSTDGDAIELAVARLLFDRSAVKEFNPIDVDAGLSRLRELQAEQRLLGGHLLVHGSNAAAAWATALAQKQEGPLGESDLLAHGILNIAAELCRFRPRVIRQCESSSVVDAVTQLLTSIATALSHCMQRQDPQGVLAALDVLGMVISVLLPHHVLNDAVAAQPALLEAVRSALQAATAVLSKPESVWPEELDFGAVDAALECVIQAGYCVNVLRQTDDHPSPLIPVDTLNALARHAEGVCQQLGKRDRGARRNRHESSATSRRSEADHMIDIVRSVWRRSEALARLMDKQPDAATFNPSQLRCPLKRW